MDHLAWEWNRFLPRATLKGPKRRFVVVVVLVGMESSLKKFQIEQKDDIRKINGTKKLASFVIVALFTRL